MILSLATDDVKGSLAMFVIMFGLFNPLMFTAAKTGLTILDIFF